MAAHRYWRATAFEAYGGADLELSEFHLLAGGVRVDATATITASVAPDVSGVIANLQDDVLATAARWSAQAVKGLALTWDFGGSTADVADIRLAGDSEWRFPLIVKLQWSDDGVSWIDILQISGIAWPGASKKTESIVSSGAGASGRVVLLNFNGADGGVLFPDETGRHTWTGRGAAKTSTSVKKFGSAALELNSDGSVETTVSSDFNFGTGDFTVSCFIQVPVLTSVRNIFLVGVTGGFSFGMTGGMLFAGPNSIAFGATATTSVTINSLLHVAACRQAGVMRVFIGGVMVGSASDTYNYGAGAAGIGAGSTDNFSTRTYSLIGYVDGLEVIKGEALYTAAGFTPPISESAVGDGIVKNTVKGRVTSGFDLSVGTGPIITYGTPQIALPDYLSIESGSVKDQITGVLGEGIGRVKGTVATKGSPNQPVHRKVRLIRDRDGMVIREAWSDAATGEYDFQYVDEAQTFTVVSYDHLHNYRAVIADNLTPELMP